MSDVCIAGNFSMLLDKLTLLKENLLVKQSPLPRSKHVCIKAFPLQLAEWSTDSRLTICCNAQVQRVHLVQYIAVKRTKHRLKR